MIDWVLDNLYLIIITPFIIRFIIIDIPNVIFKLRSGYYRKEENDNIKRDFHDYM